MPYCTSTTLHYTTWPCHDTTFSHLHFHSFLLQYIFTFFRGWTERQFHKTIEPILHATAFFFPLIGAIIGISTNLLGPNELLLQCWVTTGAHRRNYFILAAGLIELNYFTIFKQLSLVGIAYSVYKQERRMVLRYSVAAGGGSGTPPQSVLMARETLIQASIFFLSCFIPYALMMMVRYCDLWWDNVDENGKVPNSLFGLVAAAQFLYPLQGLFAMIGFVRPDYYKTKKRMPKEATVWDCLYVAVLNQAGWEVEADCVRTSVMDGSSRSHKPHHHRHSSILRVLRKERGSTGPVQSDTCHDGCGNHDCGNNYCGHDSFAGEVVGVSQKEQATTAVEEGQQQEPGQHELKESPSASSSTFEAAGSSTSLETPLPPREPMPDVSQSSAAAAWEPVVKYTMTLSGYMDLSGEDDCNDEEVEAMQETERQRPSLSRTELPQHQDKEVPSQPQPDFEATAWV